MQAFASYVVRRTCAFVFANDPNATERALQFPNYLLHLGEGRLESAEDGMVELPESVPKVLDIDTLCSKVFDGLESNYSNVSWLTSRAILSTKKLEAYTNKTPKSAQGFQGVTRHS